MRRGGALKITRRTVADPYRPAGRVWPINLICPACKATPGWLCWDIRAGRRNRQISRPHPSRRSDS